MRKQEIVKEIEEQRRQTAHQNNYAIPRAIGCHWQFGYSLISTQQFLVTPMSCRLKNVQNVFCHHLEYYNLI